MTAVEDSSTGLHVLREKVENCFTFSVDDLEDPHVKHMEMENEDDMLEVSFLYSLLDEKRGALLSCSCFFVSLVGCSVVFILNC